MGMLDYGALKSRLTVATAALVAIGTATFAVTGAQLHCTLCMQMYAEANHLLPDEHSSQCVAWLMHSSMR
jgi:hypothetical protein